MCKLAYEKKKNKILKYINYDVIDVEDVVGKIETIHVEVNVINKIIFKDFMTGKFKYINKNKDIYGSILDHILNNYGESYVKNTINIYEKNLTQDEIDNNDSLEGLYIIKNDNNVYEIYDKKIMMIYDDWIMNNMIPKMYTTKMYTTKIGEYFEPDL